MYVRMFVRIYKHVHMYVRMCVCRSYSCCCVCAVTTAMLRCDTYRWTVLCDVAPTSPCCTSQHLYRQLSVIKGKERSFHQPSPEAKSRGASVAAQRAKLRDGEWVGWGWKKCVVELEGRVGGVGYGECGGGRG